MLNQSLSTAQSWAKHLANEYQTTGYVYLLPNGQYRASNVYTRQWLLVERHAASKPEPTTVAYANWGKDEYRPEPGKTHLEPITVAKQALAENKMPTKVTAILQAIWPSMDKKAADELVFDLRLKRLMADYESHC